MIFTEKHDRDLIRKTIKNYENFLSGYHNAVICDPDHCPFCMDTKKIFGHIVCRACVLVRRFGKECENYITFQNIDNGNLEDDEPIKDRIAVLKRLIPWIKGNMEFNRDETWRKI